MINQLNSLSADKNVFVPLQSNGTTYSITKPFTEEQKQETKQEVEKQTEKKSNKLGYAMASAALVVGFGVFIATKLISKKSGLNMNKIAKSLEDKLTTLGKDKQAGSIKKIYFATLKSAKILISKARAVFNLASIKDIAFRKSLKQVPILRDFSDGVTNWFEKVSVKTTKNAYRNTLLKFDNLYDNFDHTSAKLPEAERANINKRIDKIQIKYEEVFGRRARNRRLTQVNYDLRRLDEDLWEEIKHPVKFGQKAIDGRFLAEDLAYPAKLKLHNSVATIKEIITLSVNDNYTSVKKILDNIDKSIYPEDKNLRDLMKQARKNLDEYRKNNNFNEKSNLLNSLKNLNKSLSSERGTKIAEEFSKSIELLSNNKEGEIQELMDIYKQYLPEKDYAKLEKSVNKSLNSLDYSVDLETDKLFDKIRDLKIGSAPHDVLAFLSSLGVVGWYLGKADNSDERMSVALKYGIPVVGAVAITTLCAVGLIASGPSLLIGLVSGLAINKLGEAADSMRKKYKDKPLDLASAAKQILPNFKEDIDTLKGNGKTN